MVKFIMSTIGSFGAFRIFGVFLLSINCEAFTKNRDIYVNDDFCSILINGGLAEPQPLILDLDSKNRDFVYPVKPGIGSLVAEVGQSFRIACPGSKFQLKTHEDYNDTLVTCVGGNYFSFRGEPIEETFDKISCEKYPVYTTRSTGERCSGNGSTVEIGFSLDSQITKKQKRQEFFRVIDLCHDEFLGHTIYAHAKIFATIDAAQTSFSRTSFRKGSFFRGIQIQNVYGRDSQRDTIAKILNSVKLANRYIPDTGSFYFARGHLIAKGDLIYGSQQRATFFYINVVPMWQNVNAGNWGRMESNVRQYATKKHLDLDVWVGGLEILTLKDNKGKNSEIYLYVDENNNRAVPVPKILFKVVYNYPTRSGIVFLTANNPYLKNLTKEYRVCKDVCDKIDYMSWNRTRADLGLSYCCEIDDFRRVFSGIPSFKTEHLLL